MSFLPINAQVLSSVDFNNPPADKHITTWWHWMNGYITKEGITRDLEAMKQQGIHSASILNVHRPFAAEARSNIDRGGHFVLIKEAEIEKWHQVEFGTDEWLDLFYFALQEADRLGMTIGTANCDGWSESGGPWISPEMSMKQFVWSKNYINGGKTIQIQLKEPSSKMNFYRDAFVVAFKSKGENSFDKARPKLILSNEEPAQILVDGNPNTFINLKQEKLRINFKKPFQTNVLCLYLGKTGKTVLQPIDIYVETSEDGQNYTQIARLKTSDVNNLIKFDIPETISQYYRVSFNNSNKDIVVGEVYLLQKGESGRFEGNVSHYSVKTSAIRAYQMDDFWSENNPVPENIIPSVEEVVDLTSYMDSTGILTWKAPKGSWTVLRFGYTTTEKKNHPASPAGIGLECDKMDTTALNLHFKSFPQKLIDKAGDLKGKTFTYFLVDSWEAGLQNWSKNFASEFEKRRGYSLIPYIPILCGEFIQNTECVEAFLHDFRKTIGDLIVENYFDHLAELCHRQGMELHSEGIYGDETTPPVDVIRTYKYCDVPMTEFWARIQAHHWPFPTKLEKEMKYVMPQHSALLYDKPIIAAEAYTGYAIFSDSPIDLKLFGAQAYAEGVTNMALHSYVHQSKEMKPGFTLGIYGQTFNRYNTWYKYAKSFFDEQARTQYMLQGGNRCADALIYVGDKKPAIECKADELEKLLPENTKYNYCNQEVLLNRVSVKNGKLYIDNDKEFQVLILRDKEMDLVTVQKLQTLVKEGAMVFGAKPEHTLSWGNYKNETRRLRDIADEVWGTLVNAPVHKYGKGMVVTSLPELAKRMKSDVSVEGIGINDIFYLHKQRKDQDIYYIVNHSDTTNLYYSASFRQSGKIVYLWDPMDGKKYSVCPINDNGEKTTMILSMRPKQSFFVTFCTKNEGYSEYPVYHPEKNDSSYTHILKIARAKGTMTFEDEPLLGTKEISGFTSLTASSDSLIKYYSGEVTYKIDLDIPANLISKKHCIFMKLPSFGSTARVEINGEFVGDIWDPTYKLEITNYLRRNNNKAIIRVTNPWRNRLIGDRIQNRGKKSTWATSPGIDRYDPVPIISENAELIPSGISQPILLYIQECNL